MTLYSLIQKSYDVLLIPSDLHIFGFAFKLLIVLVSFHALFYS